MVVGGDEVASRTTIKGTENGKPFVEETHFSPFKGGNPAEHPNLNRRLD